jgi:hypothetical protein
MSAGSSERFRHDLTTAMTRFNDSKIGRQMYTIFQNEGITPFKPAYLEGLEKLLAEQKHLNAKRH